MGGVSQGTYKTEKMSVLQDYPEFCVVWKIQHRLEMYR